jgi:hypothetical protein
MAARASGLRRYPRRRYEGEVFVLYAEGYGFVLEATDLSRGGVFVRSDVLLDEGEPVLVRFALEDGRRVNARGRVTRAWAEASERTPGGFAVVFEAFDEASHRALLSATAQPVVSP